MPVLQRSSPDCGAPASTTAPERRGEATLQVVVSLLRLHLRQARTPDIADALGRVVDEVETVMATHHQLAALGAEPTLDPGPALAALVDRLTPPTPTVRIELQLSPVTVATRHLLPLLLLAHEALVNALQHAFPGGRAGLVAIALEPADGGGARLRVADDGAGLPTGLDFPAQGRCGALLLRELAQQSGARLTVTGGGGTTVTVELPPTPTTTEEGGTAA